MLSSNLLSDVFVELADTLVDDFDLIDFLDNLTRRAATVTESPAVGILLSDLRGGLSHVAASSERAEILELFQLQHSEGPRTPSPTECTHPAFSWPRVNGGVQGS